MPLRLAIFDLDGTLKEARDPYVYLHERLGTLEASHAFFARGMAGEIPYEEWLRLDVGLWKGVPRARLEELLRANPYLPGVRELVAALRRAGVRVAIISTGLNVHAQLVADELGVDRVVANELYFEDGCCTGQARAWVPIGSKGLIVQQLQAELDVRPDECLAAGDTTSDVDMFGKVRLGVAVNPASDAVRRAAGLVLEDPDLRPFLARLAEVWPDWTPTSNNC
jgi:phosphoserine phosphatase